MYTRNIEFKNLISEFIDYKRICGYKYISEELVLKSFNHYVQNHNHADLGMTENLIEEWCQTRTQEGRKSRSNRICVIRQLALYLSKKGYCVYIPKTLPNASRSDFIPYIFTQVEMSNIFKTLDNLPRNSRYNSDTVYPILFRVLYGCGLRIGEAIALKISEVDTNNGVLTIKNAKYDKDRIVLLSESLRLICYNFKNSHLIGREENTTFFQNADGSIRNIGSISSFFKEVLWKSDIPYRGKGKGPRLHDLRHTFCCNSLKQMSDNGIDMYCSLPILSTYIGHSSIEATEKYLRLTTSVFPNLEDKISKFSGKIYPEVSYDDAN